LIPAGDQALVVELGDEIDPALNRRVHDLTHLVEECGIRGVVDLTPTYRSLLVQYDATETSLGEISDAIRNIQDAPGTGSSEQPHVVHVPTLYGGEDGPDLEYIAEQAGVSVEEAVDIHSSKEYLVYMMGFTPGFPYLGGLDERLATPRLETPRQEIAAGTVGIAESQTGVYPVSSPGGWRLIGRTPLTLFDPSRESPSLLSAGNYLRFVPIDGEEEFAAIHESVAAGTYETTITVKQ
jgi:KipI family sensor histidine kinase inhibitor